MANGSIDKVPAPALQADEDPAPLHPAALQENLPLRDDDSDDSEPPHRPRMYRPAALRSHLNTSPAPTSNERSQASSSATSTATAATTRATPPVLELPSVSELDDSDPAEVEHLERAPSKGLQEDLPSPGAIETQVARVDSHRRSVSGESGYLRDPPDPTNPETPPKKIKPPSEINKPLISDHYYERKFGILLLRQGTDEGYSVTDKEVFEGWLATQAPPPQARPNLRRGESNSIVRYIEDFGGIVLGDITPESISITLVNEGVDTVYHIFDPKRFRVFLAKQNLRGKLPTFRLAVDGPRIRHEEAVDRDWGKHGFLVFPPTERHPRRQYYTVIDEELFSAWRFRHCYREYYYKTPRPNISIKFRNYPYRPEPTLEIVRDPVLPARPRSISFVEESVRPWNNIVTLPAIVLSSTRPATRPGSPLLRELGDMAREISRSRLQDANTDYPSSSDDGSSSSSETSEDIEDVAQQSCETTDSNEVGLDGPNDSNRSAGTDVLDELDDGDVLRNFPYLLEGSEVDERRTPPSVLINRVNATGAQPWDSLLDNDEEDDDELHSVNN